MENEELLLNDICDYCLGTNLNIENKITKGNTYFVMGNGNVRNEKYFLIDKNNPKYKKDAYVYVELSMLKSENVEVVFREDSIMFFAKSKTHPFFIISLDVLEKLEKLNYFDKYNN